jgi:uncharacterized protein YdiU (UPF0061 family)
VHAPFWWVRSLLRTELLHPRMAQIHRPAAIIGLRAHIPRPHDVQRALIRRAAYGHKRFGEFQTDD